MIALTNAQPGDTPSADGTRALSTSSLPQITSIDARVKELETALIEARLQIEYLDAKFQPTGTSTTVLGRINRALSRKDQPHDR